MQGFNMGRYVPPDNEGVLSGNEIHRKKPPGLRGNGVHLKQTVRFEMPFDVVCRNCLKQIAQGVRFNAEKVKVGSYFSSSLFAFRMKHSTCGNLIEIRTDPSSTSYLVTEGANQRASDHNLQSNLVRVHALNTGVEGVSSVEVDPIVRKERTITDEAASKVGAERIFELRRLSERQWADPYVHSRDIRRKFRVERKLLDEKAMASEALQDRMGLGFVVAEEIPEDSRQANLVEYGMQCEDITLKVHSKPLFSGQRRTVVASTSASFEQKGRAQSLLVKENFQKNLQRNTQVVVDPFLTSRNDLTTGSQPLQMDVKFLKRNGQSKIKQPSISQQENYRNNVETLKASCSGLGLEQYESE